MDGRSWFYTVVVAGTLVGLVVMMLSTAEEYDGADPEDQAIDAPADPQAASPDPEEATDTREENGASDQTPEAEARREIAEALREAIRAARDRRLGQPSEEGADERGAPATAARTAEDEALGAIEPGTLDREYIQGAIREIRPLLAECYELALSESPDLAGRLVVSFGIDGEPEVGGVVENSRVSDESEIRHSVLDECITETLYTLRLPAPEGGGHVEVTYPFVFSNSGEEEP